MESVHRKELYVGMENVTTQLRRLHLLLQRPLLDIHANVTMATMAEIAKNTIVKTNLNLNNNINIRNFTTEILI